MWRRIRPLFWMSTIAVLLLGSMQVSTASLAQNQPRDETARLRELAERLLLQQYPYGYYGTGPGGPTGMEDPSVELLVGQVPPDMGLDLPLPPSAQVVGTVVRHGGLPFAGTTEVVLDVPGSTAEVLAFYQRSA